MDVFGLTNKPQFNWVFYSNGSTNSWQTWQKPSNCKFVSFFLIGGGAGGNGGNGTAGTNRGGGGGGGGSSITRGLFPAIVLPNTLYIQVGLGGIGGTSSALGTSGTLSYVCLEPVTTNIADLLLASGTVAAANGTAINNAGNGGTIFNATATIPGNLGLLTLTAGSNGSAGVNANVGTNLTPTIITTGGAGGGGSSTVNANFNGGSILATTVTQQINGGTAGVSTEASSGVFTQLPSIDTSSTILPMFFTGGAGGGSNGTGTGGTGGTGSYGSGGGGGGAGTTSSGGRGGNGGNGLVIITAW